MMKKTKIYLSVFVLLLSVMFLFGCERGTVEDDVYLTIDINPSVEVIVSESGKVIHVNPLNEDAELLLVGLTLRGLDIDEAIEMIIDEAIRLGFIDVNQEENIILVDAQTKAETIREQIMARVKEKINDAFKERAMVGRAEERAYLPDHVLEAESYGVTPGFLRLAKEAVEASDTLTLEQALEMDVEQLVAVMKAIREENRAVAQNLKDEFMAQRQALFDEYQLLIADLLAQLEEAEVDEAEIMSQIELLRAELQSKVAQLRDEFHAQSEVLRLQMMNQRQTQIEENRARVEEFLEAAEERRESMKERIEEFQRGRDQRP
jgi:hypothetical protein